MGLKKLERNDVQGPTVGGFEVDGTGLTGVDRLQPCTGANTPRITGFKAGEIELGRRRHEVVAPCFGEGQEGVVDDATHRVRASIVVVGVAASVAVPTGQRVV